jgi:hypothetical protein
MTDAPDDPSHRRFSFEMAVTRDEMVRLAAHLDPARPVRADGATVCGGFGAAGATWSLTLSGTRERAIGLIRFPIADIRLEVAGADEPTVDRLLERFHLVFRKGGG